MAPGERMGARRAAAASGFKPSAANSGANGLAATPATIASRSLRGYGITWARKNRISRSMQRPPVGFLDMRAGVIDQVHVVHAGGASGHAREAGQAAVDVGDHLLGRRRICSSISLIR